MVAPALPTATPTTSATGQAQAGGQPRAGSHRILLRGLGTVGAPGAPDTDGAPVLLQRTDQELIPVLLEQLAAGGDLQAIWSTVARPADGGLLRLFQPVQRTFYIALFEAVCELPGYPRVDPQAIAGAGLVVRRIGSGGVPQGWLAQQSTLRGWIDLDAAAGDLDPDPAQRRPLSSGNAIIDGVLALGRLVNPLSEATTPLFVAPPSVCARLGKTVLYGLVPVTSAEFGEKPAGNVASPTQRAGDYAQLVEAHLPPPLRAGKRVLPLASQTLSAASLSAGALKNDDNLRKFLALLRQVAVELDAFGASAESRALFAAINSLPLTLPDGSRQGMGDFLARAAAVLLDSQGGQVVLPVEWPTVDDATAQRISQLAVAALANKVVADEQGEQRFARPNALYQARGFVRVQREPNCPPQLFWSAPTAPYQIAPWYEGPDGLPRPKIDLPDPFDRNALRKLKPNVSFRVPEKLFDLMNAMDPAKVMGGEGASVNDKFGLDWICSFSIPIITICAFIVLNLFLSLFDLFFSWLLLIKICIPVPKRQ